MMSALQLDYSLKLPVSSMTSALPPPIAATTTSSIIASDIPFLYCANKKVLIDIAKCYALHHGYKLVISKNDKKRCILKCSKHSKRIIPGQSQQQQDDNCSCNFRVEVQYKIKKDLWLLKPVVQNHSHSTLIELPTEMTLIGINQSEMIQGRANLIIDQFCDSFRHGSCLFDHILPKVSDPKYYNLTKCPESGIKLLKLTEPTFERPLLADSLLGAGPTSNNSNNNNNASASTNDPLKLLQPFGNSNNATSARLPVPPLFISPNVNLGLSSTTSAKKDSKLNFEIRIRQKFMSANITSKLQNKIIIPLLVSINESGYSKQTNVQLNQSYDSDLSNFIEIECSTDRFLPETYHFRYEEPKDDEWDIVSNGLFRCFMKGANNFYQREIFNR